MQPQTSTQKKDPSKIRTPQKITQLLCLDQNFQLKSIFTTWLSQSFKYLPALLEKVYLQLQLLINFIQYRFTISRDKSQVGDYLQNIKYKNLSRNTKIIFLLLDVIAPYLKRRFTIAAQNFVDKHQNILEKNIQEDDQSIKITNSFKFKIFKILKNMLVAIRFLDKIYALFSFINLAIFIKNGKYRTIIQRILKMQMQFVNPQNSRVLNFTLMNRTMIWQIYEMVLKNILPHLYNFVGTGLKNVFYLHSYMGVEEKDQQGCVICGDTPTMAVKAEPCKHICCFYCSRNQGQKSQCKKCGQTIEQWMPLYQ